MKYIIQKIYIIYSILMINKNNNEVVGVKSIYNRDVLGEVFTPSILINEILDHLPPQVWNNPNYKWLDPCAGCGNFFIQVLDRLMKGLSVIIVNKEERRHHILSKMLFMNDINPSNITILKETFGKNDTNITCSDFLSISYPLINTKYNIILENPPFQVPKKTIYKGARGSNNTLWDKFIERSFMMLDIENGWLGAITPANWRRPDHPLYTSIIAPHLEYLHIYSKKDGIKLFGVQTRFDVYILSTTKYNNGNKPLIIDELNKTYTNIDPLKFVFLPNYNYEGVDKYFFLNKNNTKESSTKRKQSIIKPSRVLYNSNEYNSKGLYLKKTIKNKYPIVHTITQKGLGIRWSSEKKGHFNVPKVLLNFNEKQYPYNDWKGEYGMSQITFGIPIKSKKEGDELVKLINTPDFKEIIKSTKWGSFQTDYKMFEYLKDI